jgi:hypothetical protein
MFRMHCDALAVRANRITAALAVAHTHMLDNGTANTVHKTAGASRTKQAVSMPKESDYAKRKEIHV